MIQEDEGEPSRLPAAGASTSLWEGLSRVSFGIKPQTKSRHGTLSVLKHAGGP